MGGDKGRWFIPDVVGGAPRDADGGSIEIGMESGADRPQAAQRANDRHRGGNHRGMFGP